MDILIGKEEEKDYKKIYEVNRLAFGQENESKLIDKIRKGENFIPGLSLVAETSNRIVGHILFSKIFIIYKNLLKLPVSIKQEFMTEFIIPYAEIGVQVF
ncbi:unnamed protein product [marine sediment metagenome]|jgi:putative acetyltransferase|uniref:N-acetyltransferase domain-containing protein n=1 Tax=marine sediment metagenome TaxID=412755 RepID=X1F968_9ZZZZ